MFKLFDKQYKKLNKEDISKFYTLLFKINPESDTIGVIGKNFKELLKYINKKYDKSYTILANNLTKSVIVVKEDYILKYIILETLNDVIESGYKFERYLV